jgi:hypothetical protein
MKSAPVLCWILATYLSAGAVLAEKIKSDEPVWHWNLGNVRDEYPEAEPNDTCPGQTVACFDIVTPAYLSAGEQDWYTIFLTAGTTVHIGTDAVDPGDATDTYIELYYQCDLQHIKAQDDDGGPGYYSLINHYTAENTGLYNLKVRGFDDTSSGPYLVFFQCAEIPLGACCFQGGNCELHTQHTCGELAGQYMGDDAPCDPNPCPHEPPPDNDVCDGALPIERCAAGSLEGDNLWANNDYDPGSGGCASGYAEVGKDVVYALDLLAGDVVDLTYLQPSFDAAFYIITDCSDPAGSCVIGADNTVLGEPEVIQWAVPADGRYYLVLDTYGHGGGGLWTLDYSITCPVLEQACCFQDGSCSMLLADECENAGGNPQGEGSVCDPNPCPPTASRHTTWGAVKAGFGAGLR